VAGVGLEMLSPGGYAFIVCSSHGIVNQKMARLTKELEAQFEESDTLEKQIRDNLKRLASKGLGDL